MTDSKVCLIDANSLFYRAFFAIRTQLSTSSGQPTNAVFGFVKMVKRIMEEIKPTHVGVCFDVSKKTHRNEKFSEYKINRAPMPEQLLAQVPVIKEVVGAYRFSSFELEGFEADDVIATIVQKISKKVDKIIIISSDKDILQLVSDNVEVYNPYKEDGIVFTEEIVKERFGVEPKRIVDLISLMGDSSDNIPGAVGIGEKTARELLGVFKDSQDLICNLDKIKRQSVKKIIENNVDSIRMSRELAQLHTDVPISINLDEMKVRPADSEKLWDLFSRLEFKGLLSGLSEERFSSVKRPAMDVSRQVLDPKDFLKKVDSLSFFAFFINEEKSGDAEISINLSVGDSIVYETSDRDFLKSLFLSNTIAIGHDIKKSLHILRKNSIEPGCGFFDVMVAAALVESSRPSRDLASLLWDFLSLKGLSRLDYMEKESNFLFKLKGVLEEALKERELDKLFYDVEMPLLKVLYKMESTGVSIDEFFLKKLSSELSTRLDKTVEKIYNLAGCTFNINSPKQLSDVLFNRLKMPVIKKTKTGISTDEEVLTRLSKDNELPRTLLEYRQISKLKSTYIDALPELIDKNTGKIHCTLNQVGAETGRLSCVNPNLQNIPAKTELGRSIRKAFIPSSGYDWIVSADYSQIELRLLAHLSEDETLVSAFKEDRDIHVHTASLIFGVKEADVTDEMRENAKRVNFGIVYGMSAYGLAKDLGIDPQTAQAFIDEYFMRYPKVKTFLDKQIDFVKKNGFVLTILGRRRYIPEINNPNVAIRQFAERQAINAPIQGSAADLIKLAMVNVAGELKDKKLKSRLVLQVHDELIFEVDKKERDELVGLVRRCMESAIKLKVRPKTTVSIGKNWLETQKIEYTEEK